MVQNYLKQNSISNNKPSSIVIQRILAFSKYYSITKNQDNEIEKQV